MKKDAFYFPHFSNARNDPKIRRIIKQHGIEAYAIFFMTLEVLREQEDFKHPIGDIDLLADQFNVNIDVIKSIIEESGLFRVENEYFYSEKFHEFMQPYLDRKKQASMAAKARWEKDN